MIPVTEILWHHQKEFICESFQRCRIRHGKCRKREPALMRT
jgi:hypothetical protein